MQLSIACRLLFQWEEDWQDSEQSKPVVTHHSHCGGLGKK